MKLTMLDAALRYARHGWQVEPLDGKIPITENGYKDGSADPDEIRRRWREHPEANVGVLVGETSGICVLDVDLKHGGVEALERLVAEHGPLPETPTVATGGGGRHFYFRYHPKARRSTIAPGLELKARDGYVVAPPSKHPETGAAYRWISARDLPLAELPEWLVAPRAIAPKDATVTPAGPVAEGSRNSTLTSVAGAMRRRGASAASILSALKSENLARCVPPLAEAEVEQIARSIARYQAVEIIEVESRKATWPNPPDATAFRGLAGEYVHLVEEHTESDPVALLAQFLVGFGNMIGRGPYFSVEADRHYTNEFVVLVGESSRGRKGTAWGNARRLLQAVDPGWADLRQQSGLSSGEGLIWAVRDRVMGRSAIRKGGRVVEYEEVEEDPGVSDKRLLVVEPEFASTLRVMGRDGSTLSPVVRQAWDSGDLRVLTKKSPANATGAHVSIIAHVTSDEFLRYLDRTEVANGFINRFLPICVRRARILPEGGRLHELDFLPLISRLGRAVELARTRGQLSRDEAARALWVDVYGQLSKGRPGLLGAAISRAEAHVVRLSLLYALLDGAERIGKVHLESALALWQYAESSARHIFGDALGEPLADELLAALRDRPEGMTRTEISSHFGRHRSGADLTRVLSALHERGLIRGQREQTEGRSAERWFATERAKEAKEANEVPPACSNASHSSLVSQRVEATANEPASEASPCSLLSQSSEPAREEPASGAESGSAPPPEGGEGTWVG